MKRKFPQYLTAPFQVLWFETDDLGIILIFLTLTLIFESMFWVALLFVGPYIYLKMKKKYPRGFLKHLQYFTGLNDMKGYPSFFEKEFIE